ncbi:MAG TPA: apolipoprotein N-acyltransferase [Pseudonocardiaceae bacterium]
MGPAAVTADRAGRGTNRRAAVLTRSAGSVLGGVLLYASFPPRTVWWLALPAFALLGAALRGRSARAGFGYGYLFGLGFLLPLLVWTGSFVGRTPWLLLAGCEALFCGAAAAGMAVVSRTTAAPVFAAALWVAGEAARARLPFGGFPWGKVAFGQPDGPFLPIAALGGAPLLSFAVILSGLGLAELVRRALASRRRLLAPALAVALPVITGLAAAPLVDTAAQAGTLTVALVQGNVPQAGLDFNAQRRAVLDNHRAATERLAADVRDGRAPQPDLVLWPENAADIDPIRNADARAAVDAAAQAIAAPILVGAILEPPDGGPFNAVVLWQPGTGPTAQYIKRHVQPFGEYIPLRRLARLVSSDVDRVRRPLQPGDRVGVLDVAGTTVAIATCYEVAFDNVVSDAVRAGGTVLAVPTNNATFGFTEMTYQQLAMSRVRAVEHSRSVLVAATSGVSAVIASDGVIRQRTNLFTADALVADVPLRTTTTLATRVGAAPEWLLVVIAAAALLSVVLRRRRERRARSD